MNLTLIEYQPQKVLAAFRQGEFEHNHPGDYEQLSPEQRQRAHRERCYQWVSLLHQRRGASVYAGVALLPGNAHEVGPFFK